MTRITRFSIEVVLLTTNFRTEFCYPVNPLLILEILLWFQEPYPKIFYTWSVMYLKMDDESPKLTMDLISSKLKSLTLQDLTLVVLCSLAIYLLRGRETHEIVPQWRFSLNTTNYENGKFPSFEERLPAPVITDMESDGKNEVVLITNDLHLKVLVLPGEDPELILPYLYVKNSTRLLDPANYRHLRRKPYPVRLETGFVDKYEGVDQVRKQVRTESCICDYAYLFCF